MAHSNLIKRRNEATPAPVHQRVFRRLLLWFALCATPLSAADADRAREMERVEQIRGLKFERPVETVTLRRAELGERLRSQVGKSLSYSLEDYFDTLEALHLLEPAKGTESELFALLEQQVLAFYDPLTHTYYEIDTPPSAEAAAIPPSLIAIHELTHALQDQRFAIGQRDRELRDDWDAGLAYHAVIEGEATLVMLAALTDGMITLDVLVENDLLRSKMAEAAQSDLLAVADAPSYFVESLKFPYLAGLNFVMDAYKRGGWKAVDQLHQRPPRSTREVLHPEEYFARMNESAAEPAIVYSLPKGTRPFLDQKLGEFHWAFLLGEESTRGLRADRVAVVHDTFCQPTVLVETRWDTESQADAFRNRYERFLADREKLVQVVKRGNVVRAAYGADAVLAEHFLR